MAKHRDLSIGIAGELPRYPWEFPLGTARRLERPPSRLAGRADTPGGQDFLAMDANVAATLLRESVSAAIRAGRARMGISQRELAVRASCSQTMVARVEAGTGDLSTAALLRVLSAVGAELVLANPVHPTRSDGEYVRDRRGRRLPAHLQSYRLAEPHNWWPGITNILMWEDEPSWSFHRRL
jgi:transcriptional regulator with XRE-family HTH domain